MVLYICSPLRRFCIELQYETQWVYSETPATKMSHIEAEILVNNRLGVPRLPEGGIYITEGGIETEVMYKHGFEFPHFCAFELLKNPAAMTALESMYRDYFNVVASHNATALVGGLDYRASPDWGDLLGYSSDGLKEVNLQCIEFLQDVAKKYAGEIDTFLFQGLIGPRGDAYQKNESITADEAEDYHAVQLQTLKSAGVDIASALTFNNVAEAVGVARAAHRINIPLSISFCLTTDSVLDSGHILKDAIEMVDAETGGSVEFFMVNCVHPIEFVPAFDNEGSWISRIRGIRPNASKMDKISLCKLGHLEDGDPAELGDQIGKFFEHFPHMDVLGGCCGTWDRHLDQMAKAVAVDA